MVEDKATEKLKKRLKDMGLIVNMGAGRAKPPIVTGKRSTDKKSMSNDAAAGKNSRNEQQRNYS